MTQLSKHDEQYQAFLYQKNEKKLRNREAAHAINISEGEAIANCVGRGAIRLKNEFPSIIAEVPKLESVMALTRNEVAVHEKTGVYKNFSYEHVGLVVGPDIDLRIFFSQWKYGYAVEDKSGDGIQRSLQFFDAVGTAVHKIHLKAASNIEAWEKLVATFQDSNQAVGEVLSFSKKPEVFLADDEVDVDGFRNAWLKMVDTHDFFMLLKKYKLSRIQGLKFAPERHAYQVSNQSLRQMLTAAANDQTSIMCFVDSSGVIQIHTGPIKNVVEMGEWINIMDPTFNLHLRMDMIAESWVVKKPTDDGIVTSLELFDSSKTLVAQFFGERKPGKPELSTWRAIVEKLTLATEQIKETT
ncbi:MAG TPA: ChuX/HutX family heme-like substrate-binding protein [Methylophilaceae bacterium]|jgi:putative hemin transport protein